MKAPIRVAVVGLGKIAHDQHLPNIARSADFELVAAASPAGNAMGVPNFHSIEVMADSGIGIDAVVLCQPPYHRFHSAAPAVRAGKHVLLEKPPRATTLEVDLLEDLTRERGTALYAAWHSRLVPGVDPARAWLAQWRIQGVRIEWREDVRRWHPGQTWIWEPGRFGVFDPGINALSIFTHLMPEARRLVDGTPEVLRDCCAAVGAELRLRSTSDVRVHIVFEWRHMGPEIWPLGFDTDAGGLILSAGGAALVRTAACEVDTETLRLVGDAFMRCRIRNI